LLGWHYSDYYSNAYAMNQYLASRGYVVFALNYRSGIGYGLEFREAIDYGATGAIELDDSKAAARYLASRADVDPKRIGVWGGFQRSDSILGAVLQPVGSPGRRTPRVGVFSLILGQRLAFAGSPSHG